MGIKMVELSNGYTLSDDELKQLELSIMHYSSHMTRRNMDETHPERTDLVNKITHSTWDN